MVRFADDAVLGFETKADAERVMAVLPKRFEKYGLMVHPGKTRLMDMRKPSHGGDKPETFPFLGFRYFWGKSRNGYWVIRQQTEGSRLARAIKKVLDWTRENRHSAIGEQRAKPWTKRKGHYGYYGITGNIRNLELYARKVRDGWFKWLRRLSGERSLT